ncbi:MAG: hypothetical protein DI586_04105 [Micavibrio aeruginosavorus]|uniref:Uncharacterized protein n=1 Tax=Micavibrio aeruginosavorus TaxID=349221 RepID=A0A2W5HKV4_9BACT|nr:MAG: hypothetical protein DI586_04105 [Micavibrio aeruginosavorus]
MNFLIERADPCLDNAKEAYEQLDIMQQRIVDAAIIKRLCRSAYEATLRIYEARSCRNKSNLSDIFDKIVQDYTKPEKITLLRGYMIGLNKDGQSDIPLPAKEELEETETGYFPGRIKVSKALELADGGIRPECFDFVKVQLTPSAPIQIFMAAAG